MNNKEKLIFSREIPLDEISVYVDVLKREKIDSQIKEEDLEGKFFVTKFQDKLVHDEVVRNVTMEYKEPKEVQAKDDTRLWF